MPEEKYDPCVGSGFCCKKSPCPHGERAPDTGWCIHLTPWEGDDLGVPRYRCGRYEYIRTQPGWELCPAFGAGCSSPLFNRDRDLVVLALRRRDGPGGPKFGHELLRAAFGRGDAAPKPQKP